MRLNLKMSFPGQESTEKPRNELNNEQIQQLLNKLSSDEQKELADMMKTCTTEVTTTRGLPITAGILGTLYVARQRLPSQYHFGPKGWPFYAIMGIASLTSVNLLFMGMCRDRVTPRIQQLWNKYQLGNSSTTYEEIRRQNRAGAAAGAGVQGEQPPQRQQGYNYEMPSSPQSASPAQKSDIYQQDLAFTTYDPYANLSNANSGSKNDFDMVSGSSRRSSPPPPSYFDNDAPSYMSGTPSSSGRREFS
ncbi:unnamed protein product [Caenorhabditis angaria]|uniref:OCIA domain-containing protein n=1 Tax=Caenorhabditis angaria TaxID=860376 RepID=A0A9P1MV58_9PELO|nr:unnamed protein product [Caenorhabditis angaria]